MAELTGSTRIRLSQIFDLKVWHDFLVEDKHSAAKVGDVRRWGDGMLHEKTSHGWRVLPGGSDYDVKINPAEEKKNKKLSTPVRPATEQEFSDFIDRLEKDSHTKEPESIQLPYMNRKLMRQIGLPSNANFIFNTRYWHISPERKSSEEQELRPEEYKQIPSVIKNARSAILTKGSGNFKLIFPDKKNPDKYNKIIFSKIDRGNYVVTLGKVDKRNIIDWKNEKTVGAGVPPTI